VRHYNARPVTEARRHDLIAIAILSLLATLLFVDVLIGTHNFYLRDLTRYYYPTKQILRDIVYHGEFPYWNRHFGAGQPIAANPEHEVFYPLTWLILLPSYDLGYRLHILVHIYIGLLGMYALLRSMEVRPFAAGTGAVAFGLGGIFLSYVNLLPILFCAAWLPLTCLYVRKFLFAPRLRYFALASLFLGLQFLVGEPTTILQTGFLLGMYALYRGWYAARDHDRPAVDAIAEMLPRVLFIGLISAAALAMGAAQMMPAIDHVRDSVRSVAFDFTLVGAWSMPAAKLAELIYPNFLGYLSVDDRVTWYWAGGLYPGMGSPFIFSIYSGLLVTALAVAGLFVRRRGGGFVLILCAFSFVVASGEHTPLLAFLYKAGIATAIRYPEKFILIAMFAIIIYTAQLLDRMLAGDDAIREAAMGFVAATTAVAGAMALLSLTHYYGDAYKYVWGLGKGSATVHILELSQIAWVKSVVRGVLLFAVLWVFPRVNRRLWLVLVAAFIIADLPPIMQQINPRMPSRFVDEQPPVLKEFPRDHRAFRIFHEADWHTRDDESAKKYFSSGNAVYWIVKNGLFPMTPAAYGFNTVIERDYDKTALLPTASFVESVWDIKRSGRADWWRIVMDMSNATYRSEFTPYAAERKRVNGQMTEAQPIHFLKYDALPRYYFSDQLVTIRKREEFSSMLSKGNYSRRVAFITRAPSFVPAPGVVHRAAEKANSALLDVEASGRAFLVMSVTPHKYWTITIDGHPTQAIITNVGYQGIVVPPGRHQVFMSYRNTLAATGVKVSIAAALLLLAAAVLDPDARRWKRSLHA